MIQFVDIHTHINYTKTDVLVVQNIALPIQIFDFNTFNSVGLHPWDVKNEEQIQIVEISLLEILSNPHIVFIGECGLDSKIETDFKLQIKAFEMQIKIAKQWHKPLVIHCVRSYYDVISLLKKHAFELPIIFHKYSGNLQITDTLFTMNSYFSFGAEILQNEKRRQIIQLIPISRLFIETDETDIDISEIYTLVAQLKYVSVTDLQIEILKNFKAII